MSNELESDPTRRPARLALTIPHAGSSGVIDVADLRAEPPPLSLSPPAPPGVAESPPAPPRWPLAGIITAAAASVSMIALALVARPAPTVMVQQTPAPVMPELAMLEAPEPVVETAVEHDDAEPPPARAEAPRTMVDEPASDEGPKSAMTSERRRTRSKSSAKTKTKKTGGATKSTKTSTPSSIPVECVLDPGRCTASGTPKTTSSKPKGSGRPEKLTASQLKAALASTKADARRCGPEHGAAPGTRVQVKLSIEGSTGTVVKATPQGEHAGSSLGRCVARALSKTEFPEFTAARMGTLYSVRT